LSFAEQRGQRQFDVAALAYREPTPYVVGITGAPGAGKSTLTDRLITSALRTGALKSGHEENQIAVLCVDPSSPFSGGAILGDRIRMQAHADNDQVFIRSMATRGHLGGLALAVPDAVRVLGAAHYPAVLIETVGVGQMEVDIAGTADTTVVVLNPGWGDAMQASKAGLLEIADVFVINKADRPGVAETKRDIAQMLELGSYGDWVPPIVETTAATGDGVDHLLEVIAQHRATIDGAARESLRRRQLDAVLRRVLVAEATERVDELASGVQYHEALDRMCRNLSDPYSAARALLSNA
jgi:LAO/AO transport system kinase